MLALAFNIRPVGASETIYIKANGSIVGTTNIKTSDNINYYIDGDILNAPVIVQRNNIVIDGKGFTLLGSGTGNGIDLSEREHVTVRNTQIKAFSYGIFLNSSSYNSISGNDITNTWFGGICLVSSFNNSISGNDVTANNCHGIFLDSSSNNSISRNTVTANNNPGICLVSSFNNSISGNNVTANNICGIGLDLSSNYNNISGNYVTANNVCGIELYSSSNYNSISGNTVEKNGMGIYIFISSENRFWHNNFVHNTQQVYVEGPDNSIWDDGYPCGGNYWSDYTGLDVYSGPYQNVNGGDGIGDTPYAIDASNMDHYPLTFQLRALHVGAVTEAELVAAVDSGMEWLAREQNSDGSWGTRNKGLTSVGKTGLVVLKFETYAIEHGIDPLSQSYQYYMQVRRGLDYIFNKTHVFNIWSQLYGDPDTNHDGKGCTMVSSIPGYHATYETGISMMALAASKHPNFIVNVAGSEVDKWTYKAVLTDAVDYLAFGQNDLGNGEGGWGYYENYGQSEVSDNSNTGYAVAGLSYAEAGAFGFSCTVPSFVKSELNKWIEYIQCGDGGSGYGAPNGGNILRTGNLLSEMAFAGFSSTNSREVSACNYIVGHWNDPNVDPGWKGRQTDPLTKLLIEPASYQATFTTMKGLEACRYSWLPGGIDWETDFCEVLVAQQNPDGSWPQCVYDDGDLVLSTAWALLTLERASPISDWGQARAVPFHTGYSDSMVEFPTDMYWKYAPGYGVFSSPAVVAGKVYVGSEDNRTYCLNALDGTEVWNQSLCGSVYSSPAVACGNVYLGSGDGNVYCLNATNGTPIWNYTTGNEVWSSPTVVHDKVYIGSDDHNVYCLNATTGTLVWNFTTGNTVRSSPVVAYGRVYVGSGDSRVYCLNDTTGTLIWNYTTGARIDSSPAVVDNRVYVGSHDHKVYCLNATVGAPIWNYLTGGIVDSSPAVAYGNIYVGSEDNRTYCLNAANGAQVWSYTTGAHIDYSSPAVADGKVFIGSHDFKIYCLNATTGTCIWSYATNGPVESSPAIADGMVYVGSEDGRVYAFGPGVFLPLYNLTIVTTTGGSTTPAQDTYVYVSGTVVNVTATANVGYVFDHWELDTVNVGSVNPYSVLMNQNHLLNATFVTQLLVTISPASSTIPLGGSVFFTSNVTGGTPTYSYQWYLGPNPVPESASPTWTFTPATSGIYYVYLNVTDSKGRVAISNTARVAVLSLPVGGYSISFEKSTPIGPFASYGAFIAAFGAVISFIKRKKKRETQTV